MFRLVLEAEEADVKDLGMHRLKAVALEQVLMTGFFFFFLKKSLFFTV